MMVSPHKHEILAITTLTTQFFLNWRRLTESQVQKHRQRQWSLGGCVAKSALNPPVRRACGGNQNRQWLPFHQLTHWNHINPQGVTVPSGILYYKWREIHIAALVRQQEQAKAPYRCKKKKTASRAVDTKQMLFLCLLPLYKSIQNKGPSFDLSSACSIQPWEVSKPNNLIRAARIPRAEWQIDLPIKQQKASIKPRLLTWNKEKREATEVEDQ